MATLIDPVLVPPPDVPEVYDALVEMKKLLDGAVMRMTSRYDESGAWRRNGSDSAEDDVAKKTGSTKTAARRRVQTSKRLRKQPKTDRAVRNGELSEDQTEEVSSAAAASPEDEDELLATAKAKPLPVLRRKAAAHRPGHAPPPRHPRLAGGADRGRPRHLRGRRVRPAGPGPERQLGPA